MTNEQRADFSELFLTFHRDIERLLNKVAAHASDYAPNGRIRDEMTSRPIADQWAWDPHFRGWRHSSGETVSLELVQQVKAIVAVHVGQLSAPHRQEAQP